MRQDYNKQYESTKNIINHPGQVPFKKGVSTWKGKTMTGQRYNKTVENGKKMVGHTEESKKKIADKSKQNWQDPVYAAKFASNESHLTPEYRERMSKQSKKAWSDPETLARVSAKRKEIWNTPEKKQYASERSKKYWATKKLLIKENL